MKIVGVKKSIEDSPNSYLPLEQTINQTSCLLTDFFLSEGHSYYERIIKKVYKEEIDKRRVRFDIGGCPREIVNPETGETMVIIVVSEMWLWVSVKEHREKESGYEEMQSMYLQGMLEEYFYEQGVRMPSHGADETELLLNYLSEYLPWVWDYFGVFDLPEEEQVDDK